jgi:Ca-activated chloride channel family protein
MTFGAPEWLWALLIVPLLIGVFVRNESLREVLLRKLVASRLLPTLAASTSAARRRWKFALAAAGLALAVFALTQPQVGYEITANHQRGLDLMLAVDTSKSMLSNDVQPDRLSRAKFAGQDLIDALEGDRIGLIAFAGTSFVQAPLTVDYSAVEAALSDLDTSTIPRGGTNIASAIREAADAFGSGESSSRALVLFTDGEELEDDAVQAAQDVKGKFRIFTVGVGTKEGSLIPIPGTNGGTDFLRDSDGQYVKSHLDEEKLKAIANATGGFYIHLDTGTATAKAIIEQGLEKMQEHEFDTHESKPIQRYEWPLAAGILLLIAAMIIPERRPVARPVVRVEKKAAALAGTAAMILLMLPTHGHAENQGLQEYNQKDYKGAYDTFQQQLQNNPNSDGLEFDQGASAYKEGDYDKALNAFGKVLGSQNQGLRGQAEYNLGNTLVQRGALQEEKDEKIKEWTEALKHYDQALKIDPQNADAKYNESIVHKMIDDLNKKQPPQQQQQDQKNQKNQKNQQSNQGQQQQQDQQQQSQQQQNKQQQPNQQSQNQQSQNQQSQNQQSQNQQSQNQQQQGQKQQGQQQQNQQQNQQAQNQQQQGQQQKNQQGQQQNQQAQNQQGQGQQQQSPQNSNQGQQQQANQQNPGQNQQNSAGQQNQDEQNQASANQNQGMNGPSPTPTPGPGGLKEQSQQDQQAERQAAARAATEQAKPGEMTPSQAQALVDSLRGEDEHVNFEDRHDDNEPPYKDW